MYIDKREGLAMACNVNVDIHTGAFLCVASQPGLSHLLCVYISNAIALLARPADDASDAVPLKRLR